MINSNDPLRKPEAAPPAARELFNQFSALSNGFSSADVSAAAVSVLLNCIRQQHATRHGAEQAMDALFGTAKFILMDQHYDHMGRRRNVFPFHQAIDVSHFDARKWKNGHGS